LSSPIHFEPSESSHSGRMLPDTIIAAKRRDDGSQVHVTQTLDYAIVLDGELWLELDDVETVHLEAGGIVVQQATRMAGATRATAQRRSPS
jgi:hypothetical protein